MKEPRRHFVKLVLVSVLWGTKYASYLRNIMHRASAFGLASRYVVFCLDEASFESCTNSHPHHVLCVPARVRSMSQKYNIVSAILQAGFDALLIDVDIVFLRDPVPVILQSARAQNADVLTSRDFGGACLNTGITYFRSTQATTTFITSLLEWMWRHPYEFCQKAFGGFLGYDTLTKESVFGVQYVAVPRWGFLDPLTHFGTNIVYNRGVEGWTGRIEDIVIYHFLDGGGGVDSESAILGRHANLYDMFYANPKLDLGNTIVPLWQQDEDIERHLLSTRLASPPGVLTPCQADVVDV